jgi:hypothetical protein
VCDFKSKKHGYSAISYIEILEEIVRTIYKPGSIFMQDNASIHKAKKSMDCFNEHGNVLMDWLPYSPDLNPIENLWFPLKEGVQKVNPDMEETLGINKSRQSLCGRYQTLHGPILIRIFYINV